MSRANTAEQMEMLFEILTRVDAGNHI